MRPRATRSRLKTYEGTTIVGFPTRPKICELDGGDWVVTAAEATPEEQYQFLRLLEKYWIVGVEEDGVTPLADTGNQVSYTLKYDPKKVDFDRFLETLIEGQFSIRCCSVMPQADTTAYEYQPEQPVTKEQYEHIAAAIQADTDTKEDIGFEHVDCSSGACPLE
jgi:ABC-type glycerol-3-phosphate transport system substrate-binding protein